MKCPDCDHPKLEITHVYAAGDSAESRNLKCPSCGHKASSVTFLVKRPQKRNGGKGAWALSKKLQKGQIENPIDD